MTLCYYATSHGYGHAIRVSQVIKEIRSDVPVIIRTTVPEKIFREEIEREFQYLPSEFDCGCLQSDSVTVLKRETLDRYCEIAERNRSGLRDEIQFLRRERVTCVVSDIPSFPLFAAREAGIPSVAISNFTWHDIYREYVTSSPDRVTPDEQLLAQMAKEYAAATEALIPGMFVRSMEALFPRVRHIPMICRRGVDIRERIEAHLGARRTPNLALLYVGLWGLDIDWKRVDALRDWTFLTYEDLGERAANVVTLPRDEWPPADIAASVDAVVSKPGYGTISECVANGIPLVYIPREGFAEYAALREGLERWGGGVLISAQSFEQGDWRPSLDAALTARPDPTAYGVDGARVAADIVTAYASGGQSSK